MFCNLLPKRGRLGLSSLMLFVLPLQPRIERLVVAVQLAEKFRNFGYTFIT